MRQNQSICTIKKHISQKPEFKLISKNDLYCMPCEKSIVLSQNHKFCITSHEKSVCHRKSLDVWKEKGSPIQPGIDAMLTEVNSTFNRSLAETLVACNIPWFKVQNPKFQQFIKDWTHKKCPHESTLRQYHLKPLYTKSINMVRAALKDKWIYVQVDESTIRDRSIVCVLVGNLDGEKTRSYCIDVVELESPINSTLSQRIINDALAVLWPEGIHYDRVKILSTDQAAYFMCAGRFLKSSLFPDLLHISCLCHALHNVCELVKKDYVRAAKLVKQLRLYFAHSPRRKYDFSQYIGENWPQEPIKSRWGSWVRYCCYLSKHINAIELTFLTMNEDDDAIDCCQAFYDATETLRDPLTKMELTEVNAMGSISESITKLEARGLTIFEQKSVIDEVMRILPDRYQEKLKLSLKKNPGYDRLFTLVPLTGINRYLHAPLTSVDVERAFSQFKNVLSDRRTCFTYENVKHYFTLLYNETNYQ